MRREKEAPLRMAGGFAAFVLAALLTLMATLTLAAGARAYVSVRDLAAANARKRDSLLYVIGKFRALDGRAEIVVSDNGETGDMLTFIQTIEDERYETRIFCLDGELREQFCAYGAALSEGEPLAGAVSLSIAPGTPYTVKITAADGSETTGYVCLDSSGEAS